MITSQETTLKSFKIRLCAVGLCICASISFCDVVAADEKKPTAPPGVTVDPPRARAPGKKRESDRPARRDPDEDQGGCPVNNRPLELMA